MTDASLEPRPIDARSLRAERILDAAADLLERWGNKRLTMDDVAAAACIGKGTIYLHWKTREALFQAVLNREISALIADLSARRRARSERSAAAPPGAYVLPEGHAAAAGPGDLHHGPRGARKAVAA